MAVFKLFMLSNDRKNSFLLNDVLSGLRQVLATESPLKMMKNVSYFILKALYILKIFTVLSWLFGHAGKQLD